MKKKRLLCFLVLIVLLFSFLFSGCFDTNAAKNSAEIYCALIFKCDTENIQKIGISDSDKDNLLKTYEDSAKGQLKNNILLTGSSASDEQLNSLYEAYKEALSKVTYDTKQVSKSGDKAEVEISTTHFDFKQIDEKAASDALDETDNMAFTSTNEEIKKFNEIYLNKLTDGLKNAEISSEKSSVTFKFKKNSKFWQPDDLKNFGYKLGRLATGQKNPDMNIDDESISPEDSAKIFWNLVINEDSSGMEQLGYSKAFGDKIVDKMNKTDFKTLKNQFNQSDASFSDDQIQGVLDAIRGAMRKNSVNFEQVSKTDSSSQVKVSSTSIDFNSIVNEAVSKTRNQILSNRISDKQKAIQIYYQNVIDLINNKQVSSTTNENTFNFNKTADLWLPADMNSYSQSIVEMNMK